MATFNVSFTEIGNTMDVLFGEHVRTVDKDYNELLNQPSINSVELIGNKTGPELYLQDEMDTISNLEIETLFS